MRRWGAFAGVESLESEPMSSRVSLVAESMIAIIGGVDVLLFYVVRKNAGPT